MGGNSSSRILPNTLSEDNVDKLILLFNSLAPDQKIEGAPYELPEEKFFEYLQEQYESFGDKLYKWIEFNRSLLPEDPSKSQKMAEYKKINAFILSIEALLNSFGSNILLSQYSDMKFFQILRIIYRMSEPLPSEVPKVDSKISVEEMKALMEWSLSLIASPECFKTFVCNDIDILIQSIYQEEEELKEQTTISFSDFEFYQKKLFPHLIQVLMQAIEHIFIKNPSIETQVEQFKSSNSKSHRSKHKKQKQNKNDLPTLTKWMKHPKTAEPLTDLKIQPFGTTALSKKSEILTGTQVTFLTLIIPQISNIRKLFRIYSSNDDGFSFNRLANSITYYTAPIIFIIKHFDRSQGKYSILGIYNDGQIKDSARFDSGSLNNNIFSLYPRIKTIRTYPNTNGGKNYAYLNTRKIEGSDYKYGLGFGGKYGRWKLWLDGELPECCYFLPDDDTYELGVLIQGKELNPSLIEIWGCGTVETLEKQEELRELELKKQQNAKKIDKKQLVDTDFDKEIIFGKTFNK